MANKSKAAEGELNDSQTVTHNPTTSTAETCNEHISKDTQYNYMKLKRFLL